jgi:uncharacterized membrane protein (DUF4010 family)
VVMVGRVAVEISAVHPALLNSMIVPLGAMMLAGIVCSLFLIRRQTQSTSAEPDSMKFKNPFELGLAVKFGLLFAIILFVSKAAMVYLGQSGVYAAAVLAGLTDVDAITLSLSKLARDEQLSATQASTGILIGLASNTIAKAVMAITIGGWAYGRIVLAIFMIMLTAGAAGLFIRTTY